MEVKYSKAALKFLAKSDKATVNRIRIGIDGLKINPPKGDIKLMQGFDDSRQRLRIGKYRIIFKRLLDRKSTRLNSSHSGESRMPSSA